VIRLVDSVLETSTQGCHQLRTVYTNISVYHNDLVKTAPIRILWFQARHILMSDGDLITFSYLTGLRAFL
jgi:hypothetical protein